jgi:hypothetical protein
MHTSNPRCRILSAALALAAASAGCGGAGSSQPPLLLGDSNAAAVAAEVLITLGQNSFSVRLPSGVTAGAAALRSLGPGLTQRLIAAATGPQNADGTMTEPCALGGSETITIAGTTATLMFDHCAVDASTTFNGTLRLTGQLPGTTTSQTSLTASFDLTLTVGSLSFAESGGYTAVITVGQSPSPSTSEEVTGDRISISLSVGGKLRDQVALSSFDIGISQQASSAGQQAEHFAYDVDSSWLKGHFSAMTTQDLEQVVNSIMPRKFPFAGQIVVSGANHTRLQITILGDETFTPPAGQGQIELQVDPGTGTFGAPIWTSWSALSAMIMSGP